MPKLKVVIGANGAGKSTWCRAHRSELPRPFYNADSIAEGLGDWNSTDLQREARKLVDKKIEERLKNNEDFGFESTYSGKSRPNIIRKAAAQGYSIHAVFIGTSRPETNIERVKNRVAANTGHDVPEGEVKRRWVSAQNNLTETAEYFNTIEIIDNDEKARTVGVLNRERSERPTDHTPKWASALRQQMERNVPEFRTTTELPRKTLGLLKPSKGFSHGGTDHSSIATGSAGTIDPSPSGKTPERGTTRTKR